jgi:hypothetical protein
VIEHVPVAVPFDPLSAAWQELWSSEIVTDPVGVVAPEALAGAVTETPTLIAWSATGFEGAVDVMAVDDPRKAAHPPGPPKLRELEDVASAV